MKKAKRKSNSCLPTFDQLRRMARREFKDYTSGGKFQPRTLSDVYEHAFIQAYILGYEDAQQHSSETLTKILKKWRST